MDRLEHRLVGAHTRERRFQIRDREPIPTSRVRERKPVHTRARNRVLHRRDLRRARTVQREPQLAERRVLEQPQPFRDRRKPVRRIVRPQEQPVLRPAREHPVRLHRSLRHQVIHQHTDVRLVPPQNEIRLFTPRQPRRVDPRDQPLRRGLFVPARSVDLPREKKPHDEVRLSGRLDLVAHHRVVLDRVAVHVDVRTLAPRHRAHDRLLHIRGQAARDPVAIHPVRAQALGLEKHAVRVAVGEPHDLILDARAIARPPAFDLPAEHRRPVQVRPDRRVPGLARVRLPALDLFHNREPVEQFTEPADTIRIAIQTSPSRKRGDSASRPPLAQITERRRLRVPPMHRQRFPLDRRPLQPGRGPRLEPTQLKAEPRERPRDRARRRLALPPALVLLIPGVHQAAHEGAGCKHNSIRDQDE